MAINPQGEPTLRCGPTHHHACDCREARVAKLVEAVEALMKDADVWNDGCSCCVTKYLEETDEFKAVRAALDEWRK